MTLGRLAIAILALILVVAGVAALADDSGRSEVQAVDLSDDDATLRDDDDGGDLESVEDDDTGKGNGANVAGNNTDDNTGNGNGANVAGNNTDDNTGNGNGGVIVNNGGGTDTGGGDTDTGDDT